MAGSLSLDDKLLGEKEHNYCSSSEEDEDSGPEDSAASVDDRRGGARSSQPAVSGAAGNPSTNTGPKGVIEDWRKFKQLETEMRQEQEKERSALTKKLAFTCRSHLDEERERILEAERAAQKASLSDDSDEEFLKQYREKRIEEMRLQQLANRPTFGSVHVLRTQDEFLQAIDDEKQQTTVIVHIYEDDVEACHAMARCLSCLANSYPTVKFCAIKASQVNLSSRFRKLGVPALLAYKAGELVTSLVGMTADLGGSDFYADDVEQELHTHGLLPSEGPRVNSSKIRQRSHESADGDSDFDVD